ncbi:hypothetical protein [Streptomyces xiaopingdaonensis]|uniref:hypothetical protein n=1 Tax=Streptomyces xiaopingdaonensis TaxID=1565415 RepID=UPI00036B81EB|nr:hypothetical protein [Streptomyces xiaopingdaonensis]
MDQVWTAAIAALAAIAGAAVTGLLSIKTARDQAHRQHEAERNQWRRRTRHDAYREVADAYANLSPVLSGAADDAYLYGPPSVERLRELFGDFEAFYNACSRLALVGPTPVQEAGEELRARILDVHTSLAAYPHHDSPDLDRPTSIDVSGQVKLARSRYYAFMRRAQHALMPTAPSGSE